MYTERECPKEPQDRLIVALDVPTKKEAKDLVSTLDGLVSFYKVGYQLFVAEGMEVVQALMDRGNRVFLDLKMDDVEETIQLAVKEVARRAVSFLTIHGNGATVRAALNGRGQEEKPKILSVTALTSLDDSDLRDLGLVGSDKPSHDIAGYVKKRAKAAMEAGVDGLITAGENVAQLREDHPSAIIVTPGVRLPSQSRDDHKRSTTPEQAIANGADYIVVGRPIRNAQDQAEAAHEFIAAIGKGAAEWSGCQNAA